MKVYWDWKRQNDGPDVWRKIPNECPTLVEVKKVRSSYIMHNNKNFVYKSWYLSYVTEKPQTSISLKPQTVTVDGREEVFP